MATQSAAARAEIRDIRRLIRKAAVELRASKKRARTGLGKEKKKLERRQRTLAARIKRIAVEYRSNRRQLSEMRPAWEAITAEIHALEKEVAALHRREDKARELLAQSRSGKRSSAARKAGSVAREKSGEWFDRYLFNVDGWQSPEGHHLPRSLAIAVAKEHGWRARYTPDQAFEKMAEYMHDNPDAGFEHLERRMPALEKQWEREQWARAAEMSFP